MSFNDRFHEISSEVRNWGRWGDDDRLGTLNLLTDEAVAHAASTIRSGRGSRWRSISRRTDPRSVRYPAGSTHCGR